MRDIDNACLSDVEMAAIDLVVAKTSAKGPAQYWHMPWGGKEEVIHNNASWTGKEFALYQACRGAGILPEKCVPEKRNEK